MQAEDGLNFKYAVTTLLEQFSVYAANLHTPFTPAGEIKNRREKKEKCMHLETFPSNRQKNA